MQLLCIIQRLDAALQTCLLYPAQTTGYESTNYKVDIARRPEQDDAVGEQLLRSIDSRYGAALRKDEATVIALGVETLGSWKRWPLALP
jgi:hypothetical protein